EELLTLAEPAEAERAAELLGRIAGGLPGLRLLATVRSDFLGRIASLPGLDTTLQASLFLLGALPGAGLRQAINGPARAFGFAFESAERVDELVRAAQSAEVGLPLLQFALAELWEARDESRKIIPASALQAIGGVEGALARHADAVLAAL